MLKLLLPPMLLMAALAAEAQVYGSDPGTGTRLRREVAQSDMYPLTKPYAQFTAEEKARFREFYAGLGEKDEPPFPLHGMTVISRYMSEIASRAEYTGDLQLHVVVDAAGKVKQIEFVKFTDLDGAKSIARAFATAQFKPALCDGTPCEMKFPFYTTFRRVLY